MGYGILAEAVVLLHCGFVLFVVGGALVVMRWPRVLWLHLPAAAWGALIEFKGWICPLTPLENWLRQRGGHAGYQGGFVEHYLLPILYPHELTRSIQLGLGIGVVVLNLALYGLVWRRHCPRRLLR